MRKGWRILAPGQAEVVRRPVRATDKETVKATTVKVMVRATGRATDKAVAEVMELPANLAQQDHQAIKAPAPTWETRAKPTLQTQVIVGIHQIPLNQPTQAHQTIRATGKETTAKEIAKETVRATVEVLRPQQAEEARRKLRLAMLVEVVARAVQG